MAVAAADASTVTVAVEPALADALVLAEVVAIASALAVASVFDSAEVLDSVVASVFDSVDDSVFNSDPELAVIEESVVEVDSIFDFESVIAAG